MDSWKKEWMKNNIIYQPPNHFSYFLSCPFRATQVLPSLVLMKGIPPSALLSAPWLPQLQSSCSFLTAAVFLRSRCPPTSRINLVHLCIFQTEKKNTLRINFSMWSRSLWAILQTWCYNHQGAGKGHFWHVYCCHFTAQSPKNYPFPGLLINLTQQSLS